MGELGRQVAFGYLVGQCLNIPWLTADRLANRTGQEVGDGDTEGDGYGREDTDK